MKKGSGRLVEVRFWEKVDFGPMCWIWNASRFPDGYGKFNLGGAFIGAHRLAWQLANDAAVPPGLLVCHHCDTPACVRPDHLFVGTTSENNRDMINKGRDRHLSREENGRARLTENDIAAIRAARASGETGTSLAKRFGVTRPHVYNICNGHAWREARP